MGRVKFYRQCWLPVLLAGAALAVPVAPAAAVGGFQLPPGNDDAPKPQGPVDAGSTRPRAATPAPSPTPAPAPTVTPAPVPAITVPSAAPSVSASGKPPASAAGTPATAPSPAPTSSEAGAEPVQAPGFNPLAQDRPPLAETSEAPVASAPAAPARSFALPGWWPWAAGGIALLAILGGLAMLLVRRRRDRLDEAPLLQRPVIARPVVTRPPVPSPSAAPVPAAPAPPAPEPEEEPEALVIAMEAREMTISFGAATLAYRITLTNMGAAALTGVAIAGDMVSAHASLALEDQIASADAPLAQKHEIERIRPGESVQVNGEFRLPFQAMHPIRQGNAAMLVPLARLRVQAAEGGNGALIKTALVGQRAAQPGGRLQPFRLDLGPRIYREVTQKIF